MNFPYDAKAGVAYARMYANYSEVPEENRLFFYDTNGSDCTNFCSQCIWAAYGGWVNGTDQDTISENKERIRKARRMVPLHWYGSLFFSGPLKWCRVVDFHDYIIASKTYGPNAWKVFEGDWENANPSIIRAGDVIQLVVATYAPNRFGHCLYVTQEGSSFDKVKICCHSYDRLDAPLSEFSSFPGTYRRLRILRFKNANFVS